LSYTGTLTPNGTTYRLGGGGGTLTIPGANALTGPGNSLNVGGKVTLTSANNYGGGTIVFGGTVFPAGPVVLTLGNSGSLGTGPLTIQAAINASTTGTLQSSDSSARALANVVVLNGGLNVAGTGNIHFTDTTPITLSGTRLFVIGNPVTTFAQAFTGAGGFTMDYTGPGTLILSNNNTYLGATLINGGTLVLTGNNSPVTNAFTLSSRFGVPAGVVLGHDNALGGTLTIAAVPATVAAQGTRTITNAIAANADFSIVGTDALTLSGTMTLNANRIISNLNTTATTTFGPIAGATRNLTLSGDGNTVVKGAIATTTGTLTKNGVGTLTLTGTNTYTGATTINAGTLQVGNGGTSGTLGSGNVTVVSQLVFNRSNTYTNSNVYLGGGSGTLSQDGTGTLILTGSSPSFAGTTLVNAGTLLVNSPGVLGTGSVTVNTNTTFGGNGTANGSVQVADGGNLTPGSSAGTLTVGNLDVSAMAAGSTGKLKFELNSLAGTNDQIVATGTLTIGTDVLGFSDFVFTNLGGLEAGTYPLITGATTLSGTLSTGTNGTIGSFNAYLQLNGNNLELVVSPAAPTPTLLTNSLSGSTLSLSWPAGAGWRLVGQTNPLSTGLNPATNAWFDVPGGIDGSNSVTLDPANPTTFYRLVYP
jgi:fibronectin-binding autotransporter adhesin